MKYAIDGNKHDFAERQKNMLAHRQPSRQQYTSKNEG